MVLRFHKSMGTRISNAGLDLGGTSAGGGGGGGGGGGRHYISCLMKHLGIRTNIYTVIKFPVSVPPALGQMPIQRKLF